MRLITESPFAAGTPEHDHWVRTVFIPGVGRERWEEDRAKYGAASIGANITFVLDGDDEPTLWPEDNPFVTAAAAAKRLGGAYDDLYSSFKKAFMQTWGFSDEEIKRSQDRDRRAEQDRMWLDVPDWMWNVMDDGHRASLGKVRIWSNRHGGSYLAYYDHGTFLPEHGPPKPDNRAARRYSRMPPLRPPRLCPIHGYRADECGPCRRQHARR